MFGCLRRIGCLVLLLVLAAGAYYWWTVHVVTSSGGVAAGTWQPVTAADVSGGERAVQALQRRGSTAYVNLTPAEAVAYLVESAAHQLPPSATDVRAMITGDQLHVRAVVPLRELGAAQALGPLAGMLGTRDTVELAGRVDLVHAGLAQLHVTKVQLHDFNVPAQMIPRVVGQLRRDAPAGIAADAVPLPLPPYIGDVRIANGKVTLYKNVSQ